MEPLLKNVIAETTKTTANIIYISNDAMKSNCTALDLNTVWKPDVY